MTVSPRCVSVRNRYAPGTRSPMSHTETVNVSPGMVGLEKRARMAPKRAGSEPQTACSRARPVKP